MKRRNCRPLPTAEAKVDTKHWVDIRALVFARVHCSSNAFNDMALFHKLPALKAIALNRGEIDLGGPFVNKRVQAYKDRI